MLHWLENKQGMRIGVSEQGAAWLSCQIPMRDGTLREVLLGSDDPVRMSQSGAYLGSSVGRYCGRIANATFTLDGRSYDVDANEAPNHLHGGFDGLSRRRWQLLEKTADTLILAIESSDGEGGFPGHVVVRATYRLDDDNCVTIDYHAQTDQPTIFNLCNHAYFNLNGVGQPALTQQLSINAKRYVAVDAAGIPTADSQPVAGTHFDFQVMRSIDEGIYDHSFWLEDQQAAVIESVDSDLRLVIHTTQPALHLYTGQGLAGEKGCDGNPYQACAGVALETQAPPDSANRHPELVRTTAEQPYHHQTRYCFDVQ
ncbi:galactose mutarotase [Cardiobacteriaceae bacterium TAE3-ERU3]|nr:galactose mutarotase [Cardiobacteriaceae bacterium TAE3-ERU3]